MIVLPRLDRESAVAMLEQHMCPDLERIASAMPDTSPVVTYSPVGGTRIGEQELRAVRAAILDLAREHGMPGPLVGSGEFEGRAARLLHQMLPMTPHEAAHEEVWSYLTCCWLLDVAVWRFGCEADRKRFIGDVNRNTFRRMWWRAEVLGDEIDLTQLGEDELVNITERPTIAADRRLARAIAREFLARVDRGEAEQRMRLMREGMKRLLRLTPFVAFSALEDVEVQFIVEDIFNAAATGLADETVPARGRHHRMPDAPQRVPERPPLASPDVVAIHRMTISDDSDQVAGPAGSVVARDFDTVARVALDIAWRAGRVTNADLRELVAITSDEAREVFQALMKNGALARRGVRRGTYYVIPEGIPQPADADQVVAPAVAEPGAPRSSPAPAPVPSHRSSDTALRRLLHRSR